MVDGRPSCTTSEEEADKIMIVLDIDGDVGQNLWGVSGHVWQFGSR